MDPHSIVIVSLHTPKEKVWGELLAINPSGITLRGIDLNSFDHFIRQMNEPDGERVGFPTVFFPMHRVERISLDEPSGSIPSMSELFARKLGRSLNELLNYAICKRNEGPNLDRTQSNHLPPALFPAVLSDFHVL